MIKSFWQGLRRAWQAWKVLARKIGNFQARVVLTLMYSILVLPFGLGVRLFGDPLRIKKPPAQWRDRPDETFDMEWARRQ